MSKMPAKKKSCFQITSVTTAQVATSITEDTESLDDPDESRTEDVSSEIFDVSRATDYGPEEACERSSSEETLNNVGEAETPGAVSPNLPPDGPLAPANGAGRAAAPAPPPPPAAACSSRFRVIKLDHGSGEPYRRGRWTCVEYYERDADSSVLARSGDCIRHGAAPEPAAERDSGLGATGGSVVVVVASLPGPHGPEPGPDGAPPAAAERTGQPGPAPPPGPPPGSAAPAGPLGAGPPLATVALAQLGAPTTAQPPPPCAYPPPPAGPSAPLLPGDPGGAAPPPTVPAPPPGGSGALAAAPGAATVPAAAPAPSAPGVPAAPLAMPNVPAPPPPDPGPPAGEARRPSEPLPQPPPAPPADSKPAAKPAADAPAHPLQLTPVGSLATSVFGIAIPVDGDEDRNPSTAFYQAFHVNTFQESKSLWESASGGGGVAIDNKIEQAMDLVKSHLMYAVREEVEVLKEQIKELVERNSLLERENALLKSLSNNDQLSQLPAQQANPGSTSQPPAQPPQQPNVSSA